MTATSSKTAFQTPVLIPLQDIEFVPGVPFVLHNVSWEQYEAIAAELAATRPIRLVYYQGTLELMSPSPLHERPHRIIAHIVVALLDAEQREWEDFGSTTFREKANMAGIEPDTCLYVDENAVRVRQCLSAMHLEQNPPPDLAIESDVTSTTTLDAYLALGMPEVWIYTKPDLKLYLLEQGQYVESERSRVFPHRSIRADILHWLERALTEGSSQVLRDIRYQSR
jgi:Uma2 family endonuclease